MRPIFARILLLATGALILGAASPDPSRGLEGDWRNTRNTIHLRITPCGDAHCAKVIWATAEARKDALKGSGKELVGSELLTGLRRQPNGTWRGRAFVPDVNVRASATVTQVEENKLRATGCALAGIICQTRHWHRIG